METIEINIGGVDLTFAVKFVYDVDADAPWDSCDGHGPVSEWVRRDKRAGELVLNEDNRHGYKRFYDFAEACRIALRDGWDSAPYNDGSETPRQQAEKAAKADYEYLRGWCNDEWHFVGVVVVLLDSEGNPTEIENSLWCVETLDDYHHTAAQQLADELAHGFGTSWDFEERKIPTWTNTKAE